MLSFSNTKQLDKNHDAVVDDGPLPACSPAVVPGAGRVARSAPPPGLPAAAPMSRAPPPRAPVSLPALTIFSQNRSCVYFSVPTSSTAPPGPGFRVCGPPSVPSVSARAFHVSVDRRSPWAAARISPFTAQDNCREQKHKAGQGPGQRRLRRHVATARHDT